MFKSLIVGLSLFITGCVGLQVEMASNPNQKEFDLRNLEHRFALSKAMYPNLNLKPLVNQEEKDLADTFCFRLGLKYNLPFPLEGSAIWVDPHPPVYICFPETNAMVEIGEYELMEVCRLFDMKYVSHKKDGKVLCEKTTEEEGGLQKQFRSEGRSSLKRA